MLDECRLHGVKRVAVGQTLDGPDLATLGLDGEIGAGAHGRAVHQHRAGAAHLDVARALGALEAELLPQDVEEQAVRHDVDRDGAPVDRAGKARR